MKHKYKNYGTIYWRMYTTELHKISPIN